MNRLTPILLLAMLACHPTAEKADTGEGELCTFYADADMDLHGDPNAPVSSPCLAGAPGGTATNSDDCLDTDPNVHPQATETCDGVDQDCDGRVDEEATDTATWYYDGDGDGFGDPKVSTTTCAPPKGSVSVTGDCDDADPTANPQATEVCNDRDDDCDGVVDDEATDAATWYGDGDGDAFGDSMVSTIACAAPKGFVSDASDCDDTDASVNPGASESCNEIDDDCDGVADDDCCGAPDLVFHPGLGYCVSTLDIGADCEKSPCHVGQECITFCGISCAFMFSQCYIPCGPQPDELCPADMICTTIYDGPGDICM